MLGGDLGISAIWESNGYSAAQSWLIRHPTRHVAAPLLRLTRGSRRHPALSASTRWIQGRRWRSARIAAKTRGSRYFPVKRGLGKQDLRDKTRRRGPTLTNPFGHSPGTRRTRPPGLCSGATVATVEHGVPLMRPKWVTARGPTKKMEKGRNQDRQVGRPTCPTGT